MCKLFYDEELESSTEYDVEKTIKFIPEFNGTRLENFSCGMKIRRG